MVRFSASQSVMLSVPELALPIKVYLSEPSRLVYALIDPAQVQDLGVSTFQMRLKPIRFMMLTLQPVAEVNIWVEQGQVQIMSERCYLDNQPDLSERFSLNLQGTLNVVSAKGKPDLLDGQAYLQVEVDLPSAFKLTPKALLETTGNGILNGILLTIKHRLGQQLIADYRQWADQAALAAVQR
jgi:Protein of unknown function (DUF1997)